MAIPAALVAVVLLLVPREGVAAQTAQMDPALRLPGIAELAREHPTDWVQRVAPSIRPMIAWQRIVGSHALILGWSGEQPNATYTHPRVVIMVGEWDGTDLFALGLPRVYNGKPVVIEDHKAYPRVVAGIPTDGTGGSQAAPPTSLPATGAGGAAVGSLTKVPAILLLIAGVLGLCFGPQWRARPSIRSGSRRGLPAASGRP
jgi:hypothetical protein